MSLLERRDDMKGPAHPEKAFGVSVGTVLIAASAYAAWRGHERLALAGAGLGLGLVLAGWFAPRLLRWPSAVWWRIALVLGYVNTRIILTVVFALLLTPIGLIWRVIGRDPLGRHRRNWRGWTPAPARYRDKHHYSRMY
jgi:hypothetical protein